MGTFLEPGDAKPCSYKQKVATTHITGPIQVFVIVIKAQATLQLQFLPVQGPTGPTWVAFTAFCSSSVEVLVLVVVCPAPPPPPPSPRQETGPNKR
ncbi:unnamed protein product [Lampetra planeri]